jgi:DNA-binding response OmpR family regulator
MGCARQHSLPQYPKIVTDPFDACLCKGGRQCRQAHISGMLYSNAKMAIVFVIARDWKLRTAVRAELREVGIEALGMESAEDVGRVIAAGEVPAAVVLEGTAELAGDPAIQKLVERAPTILIASRTETLPPMLALSEGGHGFAAVLYRPVRIAEIVARVRELLERGTVA